MIRVCPSASEEQKGDEIPKQIFAHPACHKRLHCDITKNILQHCETTDVRKLFHYRLLYVLRNTEPFGVCWSHQGYAIPETDCSTWIDNRHNGQPMYKTYKDAREWAAWYSLSNCHISNLLKQLDQLDQLDTTSGSGFSQDKLLMQGLQSIGRMATLYRETPGHIRAFQMRTTEAVLGAIDKKVSKAELLVRKIMLVAVRELVRVPTLVCPRARIMYGKKCYRPGCDRSSHLEGYWVCGEATGVGERTFWPHLSYLAVLKRLQN